MHTRRVLAPAHAPDRETHDATTDPAGRAVRTLATASTALAAPPPTAGVDGVTLEVLGYESGVFDESDAEIAAYDAGTQVVTTGSTPRARSA